MLENLMPRFIIFVRSANRYVLIGIVVILAILSVAFFPVFLAAYLSYRLWYVDISRYISYSIMLVSWGIALAVQGIWIGFLMEQYFPRVEIPW